MRYLTRNRITKGGASDTGDGIPPVDISTIQLTNRSGSLLEYGDVVVIDKTNPLSVTTTNAYYNEDVIGVVKIGGVNEELVTIQFAGIIDVKVMSYTVNIGDNTVIDTLVGPLVDIKVVQEMTKLFSIHKDSIVFGGRCDESQKIVFPTIIETKLSECSENFELFAPLFRISRFEEDLELIQYFDSPNYKDYAMYVSIFGHLDIAQDIGKHSRVLREKNILDHEQGNKPFGGYGRKSSSVTSNGQTEPRPLLISQEIAKHKPEQLNEVLNSLGTN